MTISNVLASVAVKDLPTAVRWYEKVFGRPADSRPMPEVAEWKFPGGGWLQVYALPERAGCCSCTLAVSNLDEEYNKLQRLGVATSDRASNSQVKTVMIKDPDGNSLAFAEAADPRMARQVRALRDSTPRHRLDFLEKVGQTGNRIERIAS